MVEEKTLKEGYKGYIKCTFGKKMEVFEKEIMKGKIPKVHLLFLIVNIRSNH